MRKILIPTDFQLSSIVLLKYVLQKLEQEQIAITFLYGHQFNKGIQSLLFFDEKSTIEAAKTKEFNDGLEILLNKYRNNILKVDFDVFTGFTKNAFLNYYNANNTSDIYILENYQMIFNKKTGCDIRLFLKDHPTTKKIEIAEIKKDTKESLIQLFTL